jgi:hypothetical protein
LQNLSKLISEKEAFQPPYPFFRIPSLLPLHPAVLFSWEPSIPPRPKPGSLESELQLRFCQSLSSLYCGLVFTCSQVHTELSGSLSTALALLEG